VSPEFEHAPTERPRVPVVRLRHLAEFVFFDHRLLLTLLNRVFSFGYPIHLPVLTTPGELAIRTKRSCLSRNVRTGL
jgi:hypothetical protein